MLSIQVIGRAAAIVVSAVFVVSVLTGCGQQPAAKPPYVFSAVSTEVPIGVDAVIDVRLTKEPAGTPVENAVIFETRFDMSPDSMGEMTAQVIAARLARARRLSFRSQADDGRTLGTETRGEDPRRS